MAIAQVVAGARILISDLNAYYSLLKGSAGETITLIHNAAGALLQQPSSDPSATTQLYQIKNAAGTVKLAHTAGGGGLFSSQVLLAKGADIASSGTTDLSAATGNYVVITGTTTITAFGTVQAGTVMVCEFSGALTITHNATSLIMRSGANATTAAGDVYAFVSEGSGNWREIWHLVAVVAANVADPAAATSWNWTYDALQTQTDTADIVGTAAITQPAAGVHYRRYTTGATSASRAAARMLMFFSTSAMAYTAAKVRRFEISCRWNQFDTNFKSAMFLTNENATGEPSYTVRHIGIKKTTAAATSVFFSTADGTTEQTTDISSAFTANQMAIVTMTFDGTTAKCYVDGVLLGTHATNVPTATTSTQLTYKMYIENTAAADKQLDLFHVNVIGST